MAKYTKKFVDPYPETGFMDKPNRISSIKAAILNNWVVVFKSIEQWLYDHDIITIEPNSEIVGATTEALENVYIDDTLYRLLLSSLGDTDFSNLQNGNALIYDSNSQTWKNGNVSSVGSLDDLSDVTITNVQPGQFLGYAIGQGWINTNGPSAPSLTQLPDVSINWNTFSGNQILKTRNTGSGIVFENVDYSGGGGGGDDVFVTKAQYDALPASKTSDGKHYFITDWVDTSVASANQIGYDNTSSSMSATNLQSALDELVSMI